ncbi:MAG: hypothetical protein K2V38_18690, partial [Gemmataceae bacterium]|nr:hypothetical protein [Gemmataceae bacterium]
VKSYNAASVAVRQRQADRARDEADNTADERKRLEGQAVRAAQEARAAETELANLQNNTATARNQSANARIGLSQRQAELDQARRDLDRARLTVSSVADTDPELETQRATILQLTRERDRLNDLINASTTNPALLPDLRNQKADADFKLDAARRRQDFIIAQSKNRAGAGTDAAQQKVRDLEDEIRKLQQVSATADAAEQANAARIAAAQQKVAGLREAEARTLEAWQVKELQERRRRENQFRQEVAAAKADPGTYAAPQPGSDDPVLQCSVSVIGEGLIQLRGPIKGLNVIRTMVNQIDAPVGQVRVTVHTLQVNGERGDRMEKVIANIQRYLDHSRFLTTQSARIL